MKKLFVAIVLFMLVLGCDQDKSIYDQFNENKSITERVQDLDKTVVEVRKMEKGKIVGEAIDAFDYEYPFKESGSYIVSYLFDEKGCYEIGIDASFDKQDNAEFLLDKFKEELTVTYGSPEEGNDLVRWLDKEETFTIELDYADTENGLAIVTIFALQ